jgi:transposase-like protein
MAIVHFGKLRLQVEGKGTRREFIERLIEQIEEQVRRLVLRCIEEALEAEVDALLKRGWYERRRRKRKRRSRAQCKQCGSQDPQDFRRDGHYARYLDTSWGRLRINVPQLECVCEGWVQMPYKTLRLRQRIWDDLEGEIRERSGCGMSLRWIKEWVDARLGSSVGLRTLNRCVREMAELVHPWQEQRVDAVPPVVRVDGIWVTVMMPTGEVREDRLGRQRPVKRAHKMPVLVAQGVWPASGRQEVVAWVLGRAEDEASWEALLTQMWERGIEPKRGFCLLVGDGAAGLEAARRTVYWDVAFQRCVFHKLRNIWRDILPPEGLEGKAARAYKRRFIRSAARIWQAPDEKQARRRQSQFSRKWESEQPVAIATLQRDFDATLTFYRVQTQAAQRGQFWPARQLRTNSPLEREFRTCRRRFKSAVLFHSPAGLAATLHQWIVRRAASRTAVLPRHWHRSLERALADLAHIS